MLLSLDNDGTKEWWRLGYAILHELDTEEDGNSTEEVNSGLGWHRMLIQILTYLSAIWYQITLSYPLYVYFYRSYALLLL